MNIIVEFFGNNVYALQVVIPLVTAGLCALTKCGRTAWVLATGASWLVFIVAIAIVASIQMTPEALYEMGGHKPPMGIEYRFDPLNSFVLLLVAFAGAVMMPYAWKSIGKEVEKSKQSLFCSMYLLCLAGLLGIVSTNDIFNVFVFLEISSLSMYTLIAMGRDRRALLAAFEYLVLGTIGATFFLIGVGFLYIMTGTLNMTGIAEHLQDVSDPRPIQAAFAFITLGLGLKIAMFPMHIWLTNSYAYAPSFVTSFVGSTATKVSIYVFLRVIYTVFGYEYAFQESPFGVVLAVLAVAGILVGSLTAVFQNNIKRLFAFSSVAQLGYMTMGIALATHTGLLASTVHLANHALAKGTLFLAVGAVYYRVGGVRMADFRGIASQMPWTMAAFVIGGLSLIGVPGTAGFISKWYLLQGLIEEGWWLIVAVIILSSLLAVIYIWKIVEVAWFSSRPDGAPAVKEVPIAMQVSLWIFALANIYFGFETSYTVGLADTIASSLLSGSGK